MVRYPSLRRVAAPRFAATPLSLFVVGLGLVLGLALFPGAGWGVASTASDAEAVSEITESRPHGGGGAPVPGDDDPLDHLRAIYERIPGLEDVEVRREGVILEIRGRALSMEERDEAIRYAREVVPGILYVDSRALVVETDLRRRLQPAVERTREKGMAFLRFVPSFLLGLAVVATGAVAGGWLSRRRLPFRRAEANPFVENLVRQAVRAGVLLLAVILALDLMGIAALVGAVLGAAGVLGIAVGFAFRDIVENYLAGILLSIRQPFAVRDHVRLAGEEGRIVRLTGRETVLMTLDGNHVQVPNATVFKSVITNLTRNPRRRFLFTVGVAPDEALDRALGVARETLAGQAGVLEQPPPAVRVQELGDSSVTLQIIAWVDQTESDFGKVRSRAIRAIKEAFEEAGVRTPPPEFGVRLLGAAGEGMEEPGGSVAMPVRDSALVEPAVPDDGGQVTRDSPSLAEDLSPDTTIQEEIDREHREMGGENLLDKG